MNRVGERLRRVRGEESQEAFSRRVGITRSALANYETGRTQPKPSVLRQISQKLGIPESALLSGDAGSFRELASRAIAQSLSEQAISDDEIADAIVRAAICIEAARAYDGGVSADPALELERLLVRFGGQARASLAAILRFEEAAA